MKIINNVAAINENGGPANGATHIVLGCPRGGTSMIAGLLRLAGVYMGEKINENNNEDLEFIAHKGIRAIFTHPERAEEKTRLLDAYRTLIAKRNRERVLWGWKDPIAIYYLKEVFDGLRNPHFFVLTRYCHGRN
jgi:hypothetical protein